MSTTVPERRVDRASEHARTNIFLCVKVESTDKTEGEKKRAQKQTYIHLDAWVLRVGERCQVHQRCVANQVVVLDRLFEHGKMWKDSNLHVNTLSTKIKNLSPKTVFSDIDHDDGKKKSREIDGRKLHAGCARTARYYFGPNVHVLNVWHNTRLQ